MESSQGGWTVWAMWTLATAAASAVAFYLAWGLVVYPAPVGPLGLSLGIFVGVAQWAILRSYLPRAGWWVLATILGLSTLLFVGVAQWLVFRRHVRHAGWWILTATLTWIAAAVFGVRIVIVLPHLGLVSPGPLLHLVAGTMIGVFAGGLTGIHLIRLLRRPRTPSKQGTSPAV